MRALLIRGLLAMLNSRLLNSSPCQYGYIGNVDAFSYEHLHYEDKQRPGITVQTILEEADRFRSCPLKQYGLVVIEGEEIREAGTGDVLELRAALRELDKEKR